MDLQTLKNRFSIIGNTPTLNHALNTAAQVAATDLTVLIVGESGVGKEVFSQIIHSLSARKHNPFIAVNCGAIPEGTIDSELFGHEKGSFTGAVDSRKGYFETVSGGTIFLDEIGELPLGTQARLLRVLETGEFIRVGSSKVQKSDVRVVAATNRELLEFTQKGRFREDLYYRLNTVPIRVPSLRDRKEDIPLLFRKFVVDFSDKYKTKPIFLDADARDLLTQYPWPGNVRELKNIAEQISVLSKTETINAITLAEFLPQAHVNKVPMLTGNTPVGEFANEREILYKLFFDMKKDVNELKKMFVEILQNPSLGGQNVQFNRESILNELKDDLSPVPTSVGPIIHHPANQIAHPNQQPVIIDNEQQGMYEVDESLNIMDKEKELILKALKNTGADVRMPQQTWALANALYIEKLKNTTLKNNYFIHTLALFLLSIGLSGCGIYSFKDAVIPDNIKTIKIGFIENKARYVNPQLAPQLTEKLLQKIISQTKLSRTNSDDAHYQIYATITNYDPSQTVGVSAQQASTNRLTVTVHVILKKTLENKEQEFDVTRNFDFSANLTLSQAEGQLMSDILRNITDDIFNQIFSNW